MLSNSGYGFITCPWAIKGRVDASKDLAIKSEDKFDTREQYISYCKGFATVRAEIDSMGHILSNKTGWPIEAIEEYNQSYATMQQVLHD